MESHPWSSLKQASLAALWLWKRAPLRPCPSSCFHFEAQTRTRAFIDASVGIYWGNRGDLTGKCIQCSGLKRSEKHLFARLCFDSFSGVQLLWNNNSGGGRAGLKPLITARFVSVLLRLTWSRHLEAFVPKWTVQIALVISPSKPELLNNKQQLPVLSGRVTGLFLLILGGPLIRY